ncbi:MAG TPA: hypothetical protein PLZ93_16520 [Nocardioides sp.]|uniref:hypothetical protein n=1 Tax=uncultured Nocardioides sp. TaxID=198441 RepID=UPI000EBDF734|nr:hypothetical protein [uncultured Nocardioides sp.]HCB03658.1 hypothetical protein [Nocardioides sp.]HRD62324.1 hypothetical protein [Nocardioides sp.]HRI97222.1 hypothetical protein [Nocardioides sp.]HRK45414.1 hypothetical protein [Nocardioides sp.]
MIKSRMTVVLAIFAILAVGVATFASWALLDDGDADAEDARPASASGAAQGPTSSGGCSGPLVSYWVQVKRSAVAGQLDVSASVYTSEQNSNWSWSIADDGKTVASGTATASSINGGPMSQADVAQSITDQDGTNITFNASNGKVSCTGKVSL